MEDDLDQIQYQIQDLERKHRELRKNRQPMIDPKDERLAELAELCGYYKAEFVAKSATINRLTEERNKALVTHRDYSNMETNMRTWRERAEALLQQIERSEKAKKGRKK